MRSHFIFAALLAVIFLPVVAGATVIISEVAWMGTENSSSDEWIELYNDGAESVDLVDWTVESEDGSPKHVIKTGAELNTTIAGQGYFLLERTDDTVVPERADQIYTGALNNDGEKLMLKNATGDTVSTIDKVNEKWPAGCVATKATMQWSGSAWISAAATPKVANAPADLGCGTSEDNGATSTEQATSTGGTDTGGGSSGGNSGGSGGSSGSKIVSAHTSPAPLTDVGTVKLKVDAGRKRLGCAGVPLIFEARTNNFGMGGSRSFEWSFGDGLSTSGERVTHTYRFPGEYTIILNAEAGGEEAVSRAEVLIVAPQVVIEEVDINAGRVRLRNLADREINLGDWQLLATNNSYRFARDTIIKGRQVLDLPFVFKTLPLVGDKFSLLTPDGREASADIPSQVLGIATSSNLEASTTSAKLSRQELSNLRARLRELKLSARARNYSPTAEDGGGSTTQEKVAEQKLLPKSETITLTKPKGWWRQIVGRVLEL